MARRAASISRAVMRARLVAFRPNSPKDTLLPRCARPPLRPLNILRYLVRLGCGRGRLLLLLLSAGGGFAFSGLLLDLALVEHLALEDPHLDADDAVGGLRLGEAVVDVGAERVQRNAALAVPLRARNLGAVQAAGDANLPAERTAAHRAHDRALHGAAEHHALLDLLRNA